MELRRWPRRPSQKIRVEPSRCNASHRWQAGRAALPYFQRMKRRRQEERIFFAGCQLVPDLIQQEGPQAQVGGRVGTVDFDFQRWLRCFAGGLFGLSRSVELGDTPLHPHMIPFFRPAGRGEALAFEDFRHLTKALPLPPQRLDTVERGR